MAKCLRITVDTQETLTPETMARLFTLKDRLGWFFFAEQQEALPDAIETAELPEIALEDGEKSPSQRLRAVLFIYWKQHPPKDNPDFELFYRRWMERTINAVKEKLL